MNGASKILTVSYGTFSCTLEGFDDPFNTMKAIAEYFRDLAADDRYFGAEPPTPDAAMLHRIAEREIQRRVEAKVGEHGVVLRAGDAQAPQEAAPAVAAVAAPMPTPAAPVAPQPVAAQPQAPQPALANPAEAAPAVESAAARLLRLRAAQAQLQAQPQPQPQAPAPALAPAPDAEAYAEDQDPAPTLAPVPAAFDPAETETALDRVLAAVQETPAAAAQEDQDDLPVLTSLRETLAGLMTQDEQLAADMAEAEAAAPVVTEEFSLPDEEPEVEIELEALATPPEQLAPVAMQAPLAEIVEEPILDDAAYAGDIDPVAASAEISLAELAVQAEPVPEVVVDAAAPVVTEKLQRARARVIKIRRLDKREKTQAQLSAEDEADLANTLAALEAEVAPVTPAEIEAVAETAAELEPAPLPPAAEASVERILAETNQKLEVPEVKRRRSAIAHLKAAVLATVADRRSNPKAQAAQTDAKTDPYRQDLDKVVRPMTSAQAGERPAPLVLVSAQRIDRKPEVDANRPMPQIVSSTPAPVAAALSVRPRRVTAGSAAQAAAADEDEAEEDFAEAVDLNGKQSFAEFAESLGASSLSELLEAAAAYCTLVLDRPSFSRPLLFQQVTQLPTMTETKREDSLRNFGKLLRDGRFQKTARGQFALADTSPILTEAKRLAG